MLEERNENRSTKGGDLLLIAGLVLLVILARLAMNAAAVFSWGGVVQLGVFLLLIGLCFLLYKRRLCSYRYTLYYKEPPKGELDEFGEQARNPYPTGTLVAERMMGDKVKAAEVILPGDMICFSGPGEAAAIGIISSDKEMSAPKLHNAVLTAVSKQKASVLIFKRQANYYRLYFQPSGEMARLLGEIIAAVREA